MNIVVRFFVAFVLCLGLGACAQRQEGASPSATLVTEWTLTADYYGRGAPNWRTLAIMHRAMHDALNAARPTYARWSPPAPDEPAGRDADPNVAMAAAAAEVLRQLHPGHLRNTERVIDRTLGRLPDGSAKSAGIALGTAIGVAEVRRRAEDGWTRSRRFAGGEGTGRWRPTPTRFATSPTNDIRPFLFARTTDVAAVPPPAIGSPAYLSSRAEVRRLGVGSSKERTNFQSDEALFWDRQLTQRGMVRLATELMNRHPREGGVFDHARIMAQLTAALADSAILIWWEKERFSFWRPVTAIMLGNDGGPVDANWLPLIETPPFPEYPAGHSSDCYVGADVLQAAFPDARQPVEYQAVAGGVTRPGDEHTGMGQYGQGYNEDDFERSYPSLREMAETCANSRIWAGVHFRFGNEESRRVATLIVEKALAAVPKTR